MEDQQFYKLLDRFGFSRAGYRKVRKGVKKRLARHLQERGCRHMGEYISAVEADREVRLQFERLMTVSISRFFRDRGLWQNLKDRMLPLMAEAAGGVVKVWSAGCASGEEAYSFKILWEEFGNSHPPIPELSILATDINPRYLDRAKAGVYSAGSIKEVPEIIRSTCFEISTRGKYAVKSRLREGIIWQVHQLLSAPPATGFDLIFLRNNLLTYYRDDVKLPAVIGVAESLRRGGFLVIGSHERMPAGPFDLEQWEGSRYILQRPR